MYIAAVSSRLRYFLYLPLLILLLLANCGTKPVTPQNQEPAQQQATTSPQLSADRLPTTHSDVISLPIPDRSTRWYPSTIPVGFTSFGYGNFFPTNKTRHTLEGVAGRHFAATNEARWNDGRAILVFDSELPPSVKYSFFLNAPSLLSFSAKIRGLRQTSCQDLPALHI
jgi:hypothetical protein